MVLDKLSSGLKKTLKKITGSSIVDEKLIKETVKDIQRELLRSDANVELVMGLTKDIKERAFNEETPSGITKKEHLVNIVYEELVSFLGGESEGIEVSERPSKIMLVGLFGSGKTTTAGKLARHYKKRGLDVALLQTDTWRPAAYEQLKQVGDELGVPVFGEEEADDPVDVYNKFQDKLDEFDLVVVDTAGRDALNQELIDELERVDSVVKPEHRLLVLSADIGQGAEKQAEKFHKTCGVTGVVITKMDGTAKGGGALIACSVTDANVEFLGVGEKLKDLERFKPEGFVGRLLGMGDLEALLEKSREAFEKEEVEDLSKRFLSGEFNLIDLYEQMSSIKKMGSFSKIMKMIPGFSSLDIPDKVLDVQEEKVEKWKYLMDSMTREELEDPSIINNSRIERISSGSGSSPEEVRSLLKKYRQSKKVMESMSGGGSRKDMEKIMKKMGKGGMPGPGGFNF